MRANSLTAMRWLLAFAALLLLLAPGSPARAQADLDVSVFYEELEPYGRWFDHPDYGYVWSPDVEDDWRPYTRGSWIYTDDHGWYWEAEEPWGWGPFHYGRWVLDDDFGWLWIPGTEWGPAWVAWRYSDDFVGWAPLPPEAEWYEDRGLTFSATYYDGPRFVPVWIFVETRYLGLPSIYRHVLPRSRNHFALGRTRWHTNYRTVNRRVFNTGFDVRRLERITRRPLTRVRIVPSDSPRSRGFRDNDRRTLHTFQPRLIAKPRPPRPPRLADPPPRRERHRDAGPRQPDMRPGLAGPGSGKGNPPPSMRERTLATPPFRRGSPDADQGPPRKGFGPPSGAPERSVVRPPPEQFRRRPPQESTDGPRQDFRKQEFRRPAATERPQPRPRIEGDGARQQFKQPQFRKEQGPPPQARGNNQPRGGERREERNRDKRRDDKDATQPR